MKKFFIYNTNKIDLISFIQRFFLIENIGLIIITLLYICQLILFLIGAFNDIGLIPLNSETTNCIDGLSFASDTEVSLENTHNSPEIKSNTNLERKFLDLFNNDNFDCYIKEEKLRNSFYINQEVLNNSTKELPNTCENYITVASHNREVLCILMTLTDALKSYDLITTNLSDL